MACFLILSSQDLNIEIRPFHLYFQNAMWDQVSNEHEVDLNLMCLVAQSCPTVCDPWTVAVRHLCLWDFPGKNTGVGSHSLLQGIFPIQE